LRPGPRLPLASRILALQIGIVLLVVLIGALAAVLVIRTQLDRSYEGRSLAVADSVAALPAVRAAVSAGDPERSLQPLAEGIRLASGATFVVITDDTGIRFTHPNPDRIGEMVSTDPEPALSGVRWSGTQEGTLGVSVRGKVPIVGDDGRIIGMVSVGFLQAEVGSQLLSQLPTLAAFLAAAVTLGAIGSLLLSRHLKSQTFGLEPAEIAGLLEQREAILHGIREGAIAIDLEGTITLVNDEARRLLSVDPSAVGRRVDEVVGPGRVKDVLLGAIDRPDQLVITEGRVLVANRMPVYVHGVVTGAVVTFRDRTELAEALRELEGVRSVTDALRAQAHEFSNRLHTIVGLVQLGRPDEAVRLSTEDAVVHQELIETLLGRVGEPTLSALLLAKAVVAAERGISLRLSDETLLVDEIDDPRDLVTVVGNLVDNALDAVSTGPTSRGRWVEVGVRADAESIIVRVHDSGPGLDPANLERAFEEGFTTKESGSQSMRGLGLAIVQEVVRRRGGEISVATEGGAVFTVSLPEAHAGARPTSPDRAQPLAEEGRAPIGIGAPERR
jgi:two-component system, CitB family, sensor kinase